MKSDTHGEVMFDANDEDYTEKHLACRKRERRQIYMQKAKSKRVRALMSAARNAPGRVSALRTESLGVDNFACEDGVVC